MLDDDVLRMLHPRVRELFEKRGFRELTEPQRRAIPLILSGANTLVIAPTGSGKTEAALLPVLSMYLNMPSDRPKGIYILYITPLRALNRDLLRRIEWWASGAGLKVAVRHGDTDKGERARQSRDPPDLLITTPETLQVILIGSRLREHVSKVKWVIVDEVHELVEDKRGTQLSIALQRLRRLTGGFQVIGLSASVGSPEEVAKFLVGPGEGYKIVNLSFVRNYQFDVVNPAYVLADSDVKELVDRYVKAQGIDAYELFHRDALARLLYVMMLIDKHPETSLVFVNTRSMAELLTSRLLMINPNYPISIHHSSLSRSSRLNTEEMLRSGRLKAVVATSSLELGIDIGYIGQVIQYISPHQVIRLVQRVGRSGHRLDKVPRGIVVTEDLNDTMEAVAIVNRARSGWLEATKMPEKPYDVLANQIVALILTKPRWTVDEIYDIVKGAYPYRNLTKEELIGVLRFLSEGLRPRLVYFIEDEGVVLKPSSPRARREVIEYFFNNLSMIPEEKQYLVVKEDGNEAVGVLDEAFMAEYGEPGIKFVFRGRAWVIKRIEDDVVYVEEAKDPIGAIPSWIGEEIPVTFEIAQDVGRLKGEIADYLRRGHSVDEAVGRFKDVLKVNESTVRYIVESISRQLSYGFVPTDKLIVVERVGNLAVIHAHLGTLVNRTLSRLLAIKLGDMLNVAVRVQQDPYAIIIQLPPGTPTATIKEALLGLANLSIDELVDYVKRAASETGLFKRKLVHVARRFNVIKSDKSVSDISVTSLMQALEGTPVYVEALREFISHDLDIENTVKVLSKLARGEWGLLMVEAPEFSPMAREIIAKASNRLEVIAPERLDRLIIESVKARLLNESLTLYCLDCGYAEVRRVKDFEAPLKCPSCGSFNVAVSKLEPDRLRAIVKGNDGEVQRLKVASELLKRYGKAALITLASRLSLEGVVRLLNGLDGEVSLDELAQRVYRAEREELKARFLAS